MFCLDARSDGVRHVPVFCQVCPELLLVLASQLPSKQGQLQQPRRSQHVHSIRYRRNYRRHVNRRHFGRIQRSRSGDCGLDRPSCTADVDLRLIWNKQPLQPLPFTTRRNDSLWSANFNNHCGQRRFRN